jgi:hypothetical protein
MRRSGPSAAIRQVEPENRLAARTLELEWEKCLTSLRAAEAGLPRQQHETSIEIRQLQIAPSPIHGLGGFAARFLPAGARVMELTGVILLEFAAAIR